MRLTSAATFPASPFQRGPNLKIAAVVWGNAMMHGFSYNRSTNDYFFVTVQ